MSDKFLNLSERREALGVAASNSGRPAHLLEKDVWVVWCLNALFSSSLGQHLVFKGGTSLSKAYGAIRRFSEDIDLTYDIRAIAPDLVKTSDSNPVPETRSQGKKWSDQVRERLPVWVKEKALSVIEQRLKNDKLSAKAEAEGDKIFVRYDLLETGSGYVSPAVMLEFGARSTGEPSELHDVVCDAAQYLSTLEFPTATRLKSRSPRSVTNFVSHTWGAVQYLLPDAALAVVRGQVASVSYRELDFSSNVVRFIEEERRGGRSRRGAPSRCLCRAIPHHGAQPRRLAQRILHVSDDLGDSSSPSLLCSARLILEGDDNAPTPRHRRAQQT